MPMLFRVEQVDTQLTAVSLLRSACSNIGDRVWRGTLPHAPILRSELPITFEVELAIAEGKPRATGTGTVVSGDRMLLDVGASPLILTRAKAAIAETDVPAALAADGGQGMTASPIATDARDGGLQGDAGPPDSGTREPDARAGSGGSNGKADSGATNSSQEAAGAGSGAGPETSSRDWYCLSYEGSCTCVGGLGMSADMCDTPKPSCCFQLVAIGQPSCQCWPPDSEPCLTRETEAPGSTLVETCPPR